MLFWRLAIRNVFRNGRRTLLSLLVISIGFCGLFFMEGYMGGILRKMVRSSTNTFVGHAQIHHQEFIESEDSEKTFDPKPIEDVLKSTAGVSSYSLRVQAGGMVSSSQDVGSALIYGINPENETRFSKIAQARNSGEFLTGGKQIYLGSKLAEQLQVQLGDRIVVTVAQNNGGELSQELFRLIGTFHLNMRAFDQGAAFIPLDQAQRILNTQGQVHEVAIRFDRLEDAEAITQKIRTSLGNNLKGRFWGEVLPQLYSMIEMSSYSAYFVLGILFVLVFFSVMNSLLMSLHERTYEFGVLISIGTRPTDIFKLIMMECFSLATISIAAGGIIGVALVYYFSIYGIDMSGVEMSGVSFDDPIITEFTWSQFTTVPGWVLLMVLSSGIYPAWTAARIVPQEALRKSL